MSRYESRDVHFDIPRHWEDRTMVAFAAPPRPGQTTAPNVVMTRDLLAPGGIARFGPAIDCEPAGLDPPPNTFCSASLTPSAPPAP